MRTTSLSQVGAACQQGLVLLLLLLLLLLHLLCLLTYGAEVSKQRANNEKHQDNIFEKSNLIGGSSIQEMQE